MNPHPRCCQTCKHWDEQANTKLYGIHHVGICMADDGFVIGEFTLMDGRGICPKWELREPPEAPRTWLQNAFTLLQRRPQN